MMTIQMLMRVAAGTRFSLPTPVAVRTIARAARKTRHTGLEALVRAAALLARLGARTAVVRMQSTSFGSDSRVTVIHFLLVRGSRVRSGALSWEHATASN